MKLRRTLAIWSRRGSCLVQPLRRHWRAIRRQARCRDRICEITKWLLALACVTWISAATGAVPPHTSPEVAGTGHAVTPTDTSVKMQPVELFPLTAVRLLPSPFYAAQQTNIEQLLAYDVARLVAPFRREAGLPPQADSYGNWENTGLDGHIAGHYLSALSLAYAATADARLKLRLQQVLEAMWQAQQANGDGYLGGIPQGKALWQQVRRGDINVDAFSVNGRWVPLYNLHKTLAGLRDASQLTDSPLAKSMWLLLGDWWRQLAQGLSAAQLQQLIAAEPGGINESMVDLFEATHDGRYLQLAKTLSDQTLLQTLHRGAVAAGQSAVYPLPRHHFLEHRSQPEQADTTEQAKRPTTTTSQVSVDDGLTGLHANTQIPKVVGFWRLGQVAHDRRYVDAALWFMQTVQQNRTTAIGGNSVREHFHQQHDFTAMLQSAEGPETCNSYNMLKLAKAMFETTGDDRYLDYYERTSYNHILSSQHPEHGGKVYFTPIKPGHYRVYSNHDRSMWCCVGSGLENHSKYGELIFSHRGDALQINQFIPSTLQWQAQGITLSLHTQFPDQEEVRLQIEQSPAKAWSLQIRQSDWLASRDGQWQLNGQSVAFTERDGYASLTRIWRAGDEVRFVRKAALHNELLPDGSAYTALLYGPVVLASRIAALDTDRWSNAAKAASNTSKVTMPDVSALDGNAVQHTAASSIARFFIADDSRMGHIASGASCPVDQIPVFVGDGAQLLKSLKRQSGPTLRFISEASPQGGYQRPQGASNLEFVPFFRLHDSRYLLYSPLQSPRGYANYLQQLQQQQLAMQRLAIRTIDAVQPGEQQPEVEHQLQGELTQSGANGERRWRDSQAWFSYVLQDPQHEANTLQLTLFSGDAGRRFRVLLNRQLLAEVTIEARPEAFYTVRLPIPRPVVSTSLNIRFEAALGSVAGGLYEVRLLRACNNDMCDAAAP